MKLVNNDAEGLETTETYNFSPIDYEQTEIGSSDLKQDVGFSVSMSGDIIGDNSVQKIDFTRDNNFNTFNTNNCLWNNEKAIDSQNNYDSDYFRGIVNMGQAAVPFIYEELKKGPTPLVHALDEIFPNTVKYNGFVPLDKACKVWISILEKIGKH